MNSNFSEISHDPCLSMEGWDWSLMQGWGEWLNDPLLNLDLFDSLGVYGPETLHWVESIYSDSVDIKSFIHQLSLMLVSNVGRFMRLFDDSFVSWYW